MKATTLDLENRINTLRGRTDRDNGKIIKKLERRLRAMRVEKI